MIVDSPVHKPDQKALQRLDILVDHLVRLHTRQFYARYLLDALFWGLLAASLLFLIVRVYEFSYPMVWVIGAPLAVAMFVACIIAWRRLPDELAVAIEADQKLKLKQRLSTAWEFRQSRPADDVTQALAFQAAGRRLPTVTGVFPLKLNLTGMLIPVALALLVLAGSIDINTAQQPASAELDRLLADEGRRLKAFARRMRLQAEKHGYPRSEEVARKIHRLGNSMETASLRRQQAVVKLDMMEREIITERTQALGEASAAGLNSGMSAATRTLQNLDLTEMYDRIATGELLPDDIQALDNAADDLARLGISAGELRQALDQYASGHSQQLKQILDKLSGAEQDLGDASELASARSAVNQSRENLDDETQRERSVFVRGGGVLSEQKSEEENGPDGFGVGVFPGEHEGEGGGWSKYMSPENQPRKSNAENTGLSDDTEITLGVKGQKGEGGSYKSGTWALPRVGEPGGQAVEVDIRFEKQMEAVLSKETYPLHQKEYIRRYFLNLGNATHPKATTGVSTK